MISWIRIKKTGFTLSTTEAEYIVACSSYSEAIWIHKLLVGLFHAKIDAIDIYCDNQTHIKLTEKPMFHNKSKHIEIKYHYIRDIVQRGVVKLQYVPTKERVADVLTKPLSHVNFECFQDNIGLFRKDLP